MDDSAEIENQQQYIVAFGGKKRSGKDHVIKLCLEVLGRKEWQHLSTSPVIVKEYASMTGLPVKEIKQNKEQHRRGMQDIGEVLGTEVLLERTFEKVKMDKHIIFQSVRRQLEFDLLKDMVDAFILVDCNKEMREERNGGPLEDEDHRTETEGYNCLLDYKDTYLVWNEGKTDKELKERIKVIFRDIGVMV